MGAILPTTWLLEQEARALLTRLERVKPFALQMTSVLAAAVSPGAQTASRIIWPGAGAPWPL